MVELDNPLAKSSNARTFDKMHSSYLSIACALVLCVGDSAFSQETRSAQKKLSDEQIQTLVQESRRFIDSTLKKEIYLPAIAVALVDHDDVLWTEAFGYRDAVRNELWSV